MLCRTEKQQKAGDNEMASKDLDISFLLDIYGGLLTDKQRTFLEFYYNDDLSLAEIAENEGITRQGAYDIVKRAKAQLVKFEEKLLLNERFNKIYDEAEKISNGTDAKISAENIKRIIYKEEA